MRYPFLLLLFFITRTVSANMASPYLPGMQVDHPITSKNVSILYERIHIIPGKDFHEALFRVEYTVKADSAGKQVPLLFHAVDYNSGFTVSVDGKQVELRRFPDNFMKPTEELLKDFDHKKEEWSNEHISVSWNDGRVNSYRLSDLLYFEIDLDTATHVIRVEYTATAGGDRSGGRASEWVTEYSFTYSLLPASFWKAFGGLEITLDASHFGGTITTDLGPPVSGNLDDIATWKFDGLPMEQFHIYHTPEISSFAQLLISIGPLGLTLIFAVIVAFLHVLAIRSHRKRNPGTKYSWVVIAGGTVLPFFFFIVFMLSFGLIDSAVGPHAGRYHGYTFLVVVFYPLIMPAYWAIMWLVDRRMKKMFRSSFLQ